MGNPARIIQNPRPGFWLNERGASLILALSGLALTGVVLGTVLQYQSIVSKSIQRENVSTDILALSSELNNLLTNQSLCTAVLAGKPAVENQTIDLTDKIKNNSDFSALLKIESLSLVNIQNSKADTYLLRIADFANHRTGVIRAVFKSPLQGNLTRDYPISFVVNGGLIESCFLHMSGNALCASLSGRSHNFSGESCMLTSLDDCTRWGGKTRIDYGTTPTSDNLGSQWKYDWDLQKSVKVRDNVRRYFYSAGLRCDFCEHLGGIYRGTTCVANTTKPEDLGTWTYNATERFSCQETIRANQPNYPSCVTMQRQCDQVGQTQYCFNGQVLNVESAGNEICVFERYRCVKN